jgi:D-glycero-alpha-D-manno-heptose-7-phosphate kinase
LLSAVGRSGVTVEAPCRADLAGGTLDIWPLGLLHPGSVTVNAAIPVQVRLEIEPGPPEGELHHRVGDGPVTVLGQGDAGRDLSAAVVFAVRPEGGVAVRVLSQAGIGSGLGGSSAYAVALGRGVLALNGRAMADEELVRLARDLEARTLGTATGVQDHWPAIRGGVLAVHHVPGGARVEELAVDAGWIGPRLTVFDTGISHHSGMVNWQVIRRRLDGDPGATESLQAIADAARSCRAALLDRDDDRVGEAIAAEWAARRRLAPQVCPPELHAIEEAVVAAGVHACKACGAGGGGSMLLWHAPEARERVVAAALNAAPAGRVVATGMTATGCRLRASV